VFLTRFRAPLAAWRSSVTRAVPGRRVAAAALAAGAVTLAAGYSAGAGGLTSASARMAADSIPLAAGHMVPRPAPSARIIPRPMRHTRWNWRDHPGMGPAKVSGPVTHPWADHMSAGDAVSHARPGHARPRRGATAQSAVLGLDVSAGQGAIDWTTVAAEGAQFAFIKATEGTGYLSPTFAAQYNGAYAAGLIRGAYHFALPDRSSGAAQADYFVGNGGGWSADGKTLPGALDIEANPYGATCYGLSPAGLISWIQDFANEYHARTSRWPVVYTGTGFWNQCVQGDAGLGNDSPLWDACYCAGPQVVTGWPVWTFWQYADSGTFPGDQDEFNGGPAQLAEIATGGAVFYADTPAAVTDRGGTVRVYARFPDGSLRENSLPKGGGWTGFNNNMGGYWPDNPAAITDSGGTVRVYEVGTTGDLYEDHLPPGGGWSGWHDIGKPGAGLTGVPAAVQDQSGTVRVYVRGADDDLYEVRLPQGGAWSGWHSMGGYWPANPAAFVDSAGVVRVYAVGTTTNLYENHLSPGGGWSGWGNLGGTVQGVPAVTQDHSGTVRVYAIDTGGAMEEIRLPSGGAWSAWHNLGGNWPGTDPYALTDSSGAIRVYAIGTTGNLYEDHIDTPTSPWSGWGDLGGALQGVPNALQDQGGTIRVYARGSDKNLYEIRLDPGAPWSAPHPLGGPVA
jgi:GH25 family lysozyme M1 (1,4-beta-N-acetylmuramidase)